MSERFIFEGGGATWTITRETRDASRVSVVRCESREVATYECPLDAQAHVARSAAFSRWRVEVQCKRCERWTQRGMRCPCRLSPHERKCVN